MPADPVRLSDRAVARVIKNSAARAGLEGDFSGHSLRRGLITDALEQGVPPRQIQAHVRHRALSSTLSYVGAKAAQDNHPALTIGGSGLEQLAQTSEVRHSEPCATEPAPELEARQLVDSGLNPMQTDEDVIELVDALLAGYETMTDPMRDKYPDIRPPDFPLDGPVVFPHLSEWMQWEDAPSIATVIKNTHLGRGYAWPLSPRGNGKRMAHNTVNAAVDKLMAELPGEGPIPAQRELIRVFFEPFASDPTTIPRLRQAMLDRRPGTRTALRNVMSVFAASAASDHGKSYMRTVHLELVALERQLLRRESTNGCRHADVMIHGTPDELADLLPHDRGRVHRLDTGLFLYAAQYADYSQQISALGYEPELFDTLFALPYEADSLNARFLDAVCRYANIKNAELRTCDVDNPSVKQSEQGSDLLKSSQQEVSAWRRHNKPISCASIGKIVRHTPELSQTYVDDGDTDAGGSGPRHDYEVFAHGYLWARTIHRMLETIKADTSEQEARVREFLLQQLHTYISHHRAALDAGASSEPFALSL